MKGYNKQNPNVVENKYYNQRMINMNNPNFNQQNNFDFDYIVGHNNSFFDSVDYYFDNQADF